ncbi:VWA-like domain-containing protein [Hydrogenophaga sp. 2FB]|uniref:VWA-like domain-containing protein n=1 Tax=Hydrogenophaga sp. 2FB TaxID=2502187 RepID=UPI0010F82F28|nr:VWA-like domain-containing protein [Hydrogenophaga sp. 2FB]
MAANTSVTESPQAVVHKHKSVEAVLGIGKGGKRLNTNAQHLQDQLEDYRDDFLEIKSHFTGRNNMRYDYMREGLLGEIVSRTPIFIYDLPELLGQVRTAFVDISGRMYIAAPFFERLVAEQAAGLDSLNFIFRHEADHLRRLHLARMVDLPPDISNAAQDIRINSDIVKSGCSQSWSEKNGGRDPSKSELEAEIRDFFARHAAAKSAISIGWAMNYEDFSLYDGLSEEEIGAILMKDWKEPPKIPNEKVPFDKIMEGAAQESDGVKAQVLHPTTAGGKSKLMVPADLSALSQELRRIGAAKANPKTVKDTDLQSCLDALTKLRSHPCIGEADSEHGRHSMACAGKGTVHHSANTGSVYLDALQPSERVDLAIQILEQILNPQAGSSLGAAPQQNGVTVTDLERSLGRGGNGTPQPGQQQSGQPDKSSQDGTGTENMVPSPNVYGSHDHVMDTKDLINTLNSAGVSASTMEKLGYDDLLKVEEEISSTKSGIVSAINKATEDMMSLGSKYPGGHMVNYAKAQLHDFFKPVITWEMAMKKIIEGAGKGTRFDMAEPWTIYHVDAADMGFSHQRDVPYMGSTVPGKEQKPLVFVPIDTSGSVNDGQLKRFISESINMARRVSRSVAPEVVIVFADTIARGEPVYIDEKNYRSILEKGITYGGRGGTNLQAGIESLFEMVKPRSKSKYAGRKIDAIVYFTDTYDTTPSGKRLLKKAQECGMRQMPTTLFLAPRECFNQEFKDGVSSFADTIFFDTKSLTKIDMKQIDRHQDARNRSLKPA